MRKELELSVTLLQRQAALRPMNAETMGEALEILFSKMRAEHSSDWIEAEDHAKNAG